MEKPSSQDPKKEQLQLNPQEKILFSQFAIHLSRAFVQTHNFGTEHIYAKDAIQQSYDILKNILKDKEEVILFVAEGKLQYNFIPLEEKNFLVQKMIELFSKTRLVSLKFKKDASVDDFKKLLTIFHARPEEILAAGGVEAQAASAKINTIEINPMKYELISKDDKVVGKNTEMPKVDEVTETTKEKEAIPEKKEDEILEDSLFSVDNFSDKKEPEKDVSGVVEEKTEFEIQETPDKKLKKMKKVLDGVSDGVIIFSGGGKIAFINAAAKEIVKPWYEEGAGEIRESMLESVKTWPQQEIEISSGEVSRLLASIKCVNKNEQGEIESIIFKSRE